MTRQPDQKTEEAIAADGTFATMLRRPGLADDEASGGRSSALRQRGHVLLVVLFVVYLVLLAWTVVWKLDVPYVGAAALLPRPIKLIPFVPSAEAGASAPLEIVANIVLFVPFGLYLGLLAPTWQWWKSAGVFVGASLVLETTQHLLSTGSFDTTDVIVNTAGGLAGVGLLALARRTTPGKDRRRHDQGLLDRDGGLAARDRDLRRLAAALRAAAGCHLPQAPRRRLARNHALNEEIHIGHVKGNSIEL